MDHRDLLVDRLVGADHDLEVAVAVEVAMAGEETMRRI